MHLLAVLARYRDFRLLMLGTVLTNLTMPAQFISLSFWAIDTYPKQEVLVSSLLIAIRGVGMLACSLIGGAIADRYERRKVLLCCEFAAATITLVLAYCMIMQPFGAATIAPVMLLVFLSASNLAIDGPSRSASLAVVVEPKDMGRAIALSNIAQQLTFPIVLPLVGYMVSVIGPGKVILASAAAWVIVIPVISMLRYSSRTIAHQRTSAGFVTDIRQGLGYVRRDSVIFAIVAMLVVIQVIGMPGVGPLGPVWMTEVLGLSRSQFGFVAMFWGVGAVASSVVFGVFGAVPRRGTTLAVMVLLFAAGGIVFAHSREPWLTTAANFVIGFAMVGSMVTAMTIIQHVVAEEMRGRVMGLFPLVMGLSMAAVAPVGFSGQAFGLPLVVPIFEWTALGLGLLIILAAPGLRRVRPGGPAAHPPAPAPAPAFADSPGPGG
jgi:MFS transporter, DHA1 family, staphyloferrin A biosynthesis exporter